MSTSPPAQTSVRKGRGQGDSKRQAQGTSTSPQPYIHKDNTGYFDGSLSSDQVHDSQAYDTFTSSVENTEQARTPGANSSLPALFGSSASIAAASNSPARATSSKFAVPKAPQSARHQIGPGSPVQTTAPLTGGQSRPKAQTGKSGMSANGGSGSGSSESHNNNAASPANSSKITPSGHSNQFTFTNYIEGHNHRGPSSFAMMDLDEALRALYFAPLPLIVLDNNRNVKMLNRPAELVLGVGATYCAGQRFERYVEQSYRSAYTIALNEAAENIAKASPGMTKPVATRLKVQPSEGRAASLVDLSISAWFATDTIFESDRSMHGRESSEPSPSTSSPYYGGGGAGLGGAASASPALHEALYTVSIIPSRTMDRDISPSDDQAKMAETLKEAVYNHVEVAVMALSKDGHTIIRNKACDEILASFDRKEPELWNEKSKMEKMKEEGRPFGLSWIDEMMLCYDEKYERLLGDEDWPIVKSAFMGQSAPPIAVGCVSKATGERTLLEVAGIPMRDNGGYGEHIGGLIILKNITDEQDKLKERVQEQGDAYFKQTCDAMPQLVWVTSPTGYHEWFSKSWYEYTSGTSYESQGVGWASFFHEEDLPEASKRWSQSLRTGELYETAYRCRRYDGEWRWFLGRALPMRDEATGTIIKWFGTCTDIHDQVEALSASRRAQGQLETVINHAAMTLWAVDRDGLITVAEGPGVRQLKLMLPGTPGSEREVGGGSYHDRRSEVDSNHPSNSASGHAASKKSMIGRSIYSVWDSTNIRVSMAKALKGDSVVEEMEIDGRWFRTSYTPLRSQSHEVNTLMEGNDADDDVDTSEGEIIGVVGASMDITDRKRVQEQMEESLLEKTRALAAEGAAREASRLKSEFLANMSHEIRTPIAGVIGLSELLLDEKGLTPQHRDYAETIQRSAEGLLTVINDVLDFSKVEIGKLDVEQSPFNLEVLLRDAKRMLSFATQKKGLDFRDSVELNYKGQVVGDVGRLRQVVTNLLTNAIKFTAKGYISLEVAELSEDKTNIMVRFDVRDTGCGINSESLARLFQPFSQADPSTARRFGGTGLGLSISKNLVELMNGEIGLNSVEGQGSHAWFIIPFRKASALEDEERSRLLEASAESPASASGYTGGMPIAERTSLTRDRKDIWILIAEDNTVNAQIASKNIKKMGFNCRTAENGLLALEELNRNSYDAVLMDCQMPECDGYEATRLIRKSANQDVRILPVIALTASAIKGDRERAIEAGMVDYLAKPVKRPALESTLCKWLYDIDARQSLSKFISPSTAPSSKVLSAPAPPNFSAVKWNEQVQVSGGKANVSLSSKPTDILTTPQQLASGVAAALSKQEAQATSERRLSASEAVFDSLKSTGMNLPHQSDLFRNGDALSAAAVLLSARRSSAEAIAQIKPVRPALSPRSISHGTGSNNSSHTTSATSLSNNSSSTKSAFTGSSSLKSSWSREMGTGKPHMFRRSSREQAGMGRDLDGEVFQATFASPPGLAAQSMKDGRENQAQPRQQSISEENE